MVPKLIDYRLRSLDATLAHMPAQATECALAFLKVPSPNEEFGQEAGLTLGELAWGRPLMAQVHGKDDTNRLLVTLFDGEICLNETLVEVGLARINRKAHVSALDQPLYKQILAAQQKALKSRCNMWQYGDVESDDDEPAWGKRR